MNASQPSLLLITDVYDDSWRVRPFNDSSQRSYQLLPADYVLRGVPLSAGQHHLRLEYVPPFFTGGVVVSLIRQVTSG